MLSRLLSILLTAMIVACPCFCKAGGGECGSEHAEVHCHCHCCHVELPGHSQHEESTPSDDDAQPVSDHSPQSNDCGHQCICKGAVVEDAGQFDVSLDVNCWVAVASLPQISFVDASVSPSGALRASPPPDDGANPGRMLCCRYETFLC